MTRRKYRITNRHLRGACKRQRAIFRQAWPNGAVVSLATLRRAARLGLNLRWFAERFLSFSARKAYLAETATDRQAYLAETATAWEAYEAAPTPVLQVYEAARATALQVYDAATAPALWSAIKAHGLRRVKPC